jgi:hypothetical protein
MGVDDGGHGIGGVMEAVYELKAQATIKARVKRR